MGKKHFGVLTVVCALLLIAMPAVAHHSIASEYDFDKPLELTGVLTRVEFINPHSLFQLEVANPDGTKTEWVFQAGGAGNIRHQLNFMKPTEMLGKTYTFYGFGLKTGKPGGFVKGIKMPDGRTITMWLGDPNGN